MNPAQPIYMDYNATAPVRPEIVQAMTEALHYHGNASSIHHFGRQARARIETARYAVARLVGARPEEVIFTSGGTEANNLALRGVAAEHVYISAIEHDSVIRAAPAKSTLLPVLRTGIADLEALDALLGKSAQPALVSLMLANNETGIVQPVAQAAQIAHAHGALLHCDAVQAVGKIPVDCSALGADFLSLSAHKFGGPQGVGALIVRNGLPLVSQIYGGGQERGYRAGTENVAALAGFGMAAQLAYNTACTENNQIAALRDMLENAVQSLTPQAVFFGRGQQRLPNTSCFALPGIEAATLVMNLDLAGVAVSAGAACSSGKVARPAVLTSMGVAAALAESAIRISLGWASRQQDVETFLSVWKMIAGRLSMRQAS
ncbi:MAG: cysteine desulfurase family protein [Pseudomonadota bacterium]